MSLARLIRNLLDKTGGAPALSEYEAHQLFAAMLDGGIADLELGALMAALHAKDITLPELLGFHSALVERRFRLDPPPGAVRPVVLASQLGVRDQPNLLPLLALMLKQLGLPVLVHGALNGDGRVASAYIFRELGVMPCAHLSQAQVALAEHKLAFVPGAVLAPGLAGLLGLRGRLGLDSIAATLAKLLDPFDGASLLVVAIGDEAERGLLREFLRVTGSNALLLDGTEGEAFADPRCRPAIEHVHDGAVELLFEAEAGPHRNVASLPQAMDAASTAHWTRRAISGEATLPLPLVNQIACCLYGSGYTHDMNQAKAIAALETGSMAAA